jgi:ADP-L-glycero-D-manno-heptose 6-epimerase
MKGLVTGGAGFIGANLARALERQGFELKILDDFSHSAESNLEGLEGEILRGDLSEVEILLKGWRPDVIFHQAALTDTTVLDEGEMRRVNVEGFQKVLDLAAGCGARVIHASSAAVYGAGPTPMREDQALQPLNPYGVSKMEGEALADRYAERNGLVIVGLRYFNVYGPLEHHKGKSASMIWQLALQMAGGKRPRLFKSGEQVRDHVFVDDVVHANLLSMKRTTGGIFNVGTGRSVSFNDVVLALNETLGYDYEPEYIENPYDFYQNRTLADIERVRGELSYEPEFDIRSGIKNYFGRVDVREWIRKNR